MFGPERLFADIQSYTEAGNKQSGGEGDRWTADWTAKRLSSAGFEVERQTFDVPWFEASRCDLRLGDLTIPLVAQPLAIETGEAGLAAPLRLAEIPEHLDGAIAVVSLPFRPWSSSVARSGQIGRASDRDRGGQYG